MIAALKEHRQEDWEFMRALMKEEIAPLIAANATQDSKARNWKRSQSSIIPEIELLPIQKYVALHPNVEPTDPILKALARPVPVGTVLPANIVPPETMWTRGRICNLTDFELNDLAWFYNVSFHGANHRQRQTAYCLFVGV
uniref:Uncharacterized protein n=1 Tax=Cryptomonas curvata TaxID=233186 RepID=A0A7S0QM38_9CRYP|mmetsp:Transcript_35375/g.74075  ORF Transcript_35375/g.74075 Transcript_35375/m.74075 type:complete len:141 (+) Transcript_35375:161-583(+)